MPLEILSIRFNHDTSSATSDAINIRKNATQVVTLPEWRRGETIQPEQSAAAYAQRAPADRTRPFTIKARFRRSSDMPSVIRIRARDPRPVEPIPQGCGPVVTWFLVSVLTGLFRSVNVLGNVAERDVSFTGDDSGEVSFELPFAIVDRAGVRLDHITWQWEYRQGGTWVPFDLPTHHRIYCLLSMPNPPWSQTYEIDPGFFNPFLPWTDVLDYACRWAALSGDVHTAAERVTYGVYALGPSQIVYDCPNLGMPHYMRHGLFLCSEFLERLAGHTGCGLYVNCTDCAAIVITFANILGANLRKRKMHAPDWNPEAQPRDNSPRFDVNEIVAIGTGVWSRACTWGRFNYHDVAWLDPNEQVYDACLQVDGDADPSTAPHVPLLPTRMPFASEYLQRLAAPGPTGQGQCVPESLSDEVYIFYA